MNNDTLVDPEFVNNFVDGFKKLPNAGVLQSKIVKMDNPEVLDSCGSYWTDSSFLYYIGNGKNASNNKFNKPFQIFSVKGASMMIKREVIEKIGLFDDDFWNYYEETDFCHRAWNSGYEVWYWPEAVCYHAMGGTSLTFPNSYIQFHNFKNKMMSFIKNFEVGNLILVLPIFLVFNLIISVIWIIQGKFSHSTSLIKAIIWNIKYLGRTLLKRSFVQKHREVKDSYYLRKVKRNPNIMYFYYLFNYKLENYEDEY